MQTKNVNVKMQRFLDKLPHMSTSKLIDHLIDEHSFGYLRSYEDGNEVIRQAREAVANELDLRIPPRSTHVARARKKRKRRANRTLRRTGKVTPKFMSMAGNGQRRPKPR